MSDLPGQWRHCRTDPEAMTAYGMETGDQMADRIEELEADHDHARSVGLYQAEHIHRLNDRIAELGAENAAAYDKGYDDALARRERGLSR